MQSKLFGIMSVDFNVKGQLLIIYSPLVIQLINKKGNTMRKCMWCSQTLKEACNSVRREVLYKILMVFGNPMKLGRLINFDHMKHNQSPSRQTFVRHVSIKNDLK